jgi:hypothetical protein
MIAKTIIYKERLGDVLRCLPAAKLLADRGNEVFIDCYDQYAGVFDMVSYCKQGNQGDQIDLQIWPTRYDAFRASRKPWHDFVYDHPEIKDANKTNIILDRLDKKPARGLPENYNLVAPFGASQSDYRNPLLIIKNARQQLGKDNFYVLTPPEIKIEGLDTYTAPSVLEMAKAIRGAENFWAINSSPMILASAVRSGKETMFFPQRNGFEADNVWDFDGLIKAD